MKAVLTYGRFNPPSVGHETVVKAMRVIREEQSATAFMFASHVTTHFHPGQTNNPLLMEDKMRFLRLAFPDITIGGTSKEEFSIFHQLRKLEALGYKDIIVTLGTDRAGYFERMLNSYNGKDYTFDSITVVEVNRAPVNWSASQLRAYAMDNDFTSFRSGLPTNLEKSLSLSAELFNLVREGLPGDYLNY